MAGRVLIIDPNPGNRLLLKSLLLAAYCAVDTLSDAAAPDAAARAGDVDLVFIEGGCAGADALLQALKRTPHTAHLPVIVTVPRHAAGDEALTAAFRAGADDVMTRPYSAVALHARMRMFLRLKRMHDELSLRGDTADLLAGCAGMAEPGAGWQGPPAPLVVLDPEPRALAALGGRLTASMARPVLRCGSPGETLAACGAQPVAAVLAAMTGPRAADLGFRLIGNMQADPALRHTPVLAVVPVGDEAMASRALDMGAADFVTPEVPMAELVARIDALDRRRILSALLRDQVRSGMRMAITDPLTGLYNRHYANRHVPRLLARSGTAERAFTLMMLDLDNFKAINDGHGHGCGDRVLRAVAERLRDNVRSVDLVARQGGEEFLIAMPDTAPETGARAAERLRAAVSALRIRPAPALPPLSVTISVGVAVAMPGRQPSFERLCAEADRALYESKLAGRNCVHFASAAA
ncbi:diguanylate cyclase [Rhodobacteraceae bacterium 2CG4]|uniref:diguanylate cyclase n=1 Tax=Halovulum marinum TaxID=2662447 RepID=A0A6L5YVH5_9RHOB|nr:diguanylate cyclase [Halovulum marinum]MSU88301.1 diguanylate cyclase [Halovulum marinum]